MLLSLVMGYPAGERLRSNTFLRLTLGTPNKKTPQASSKRLRKIETISTLQNSLSRISEAGVLSF